MNLLREALHDLVRLVLVVDVGCALVAWAMGLHHSLLMIEDMPKWNWLSLRHPLPSQLPERYHANRRQSLRLGFVFVVLVAIGACLMLLDRMLLGVSC